MCQAAMTRKIMSLNALWRQAMTGRRFRYRCFITKTRRLMAQRRFCNMAMAHMALPFPPVFPQHGSALLTEGFIYAIGHIRGGKARGRNWFMQGRRENKPNSFRDFVSVARALIDKGWTKAGNITIHGGSAGGLLVGATVNLAPDLFRACRGRSAICRCADDYAGRHAAPDAARMARMGQSDCQRGRLPAD